jgi:hypothetical protein
MQAGFNGVNPAALVDDLIKVKLLLQKNTNLCLLQTYALNMEMLTAAGLMLNNANDPRFGKANTKANYLKMSRALEYYEGYCWFPANRALLSGLLSTPSFNSSLQLGMNKDVGAGRAHGDQSHRLQWHAILRVVTNGFTVPFHANSGWSHSPLELFFHYTQGNAVVANAWGTTMDSQGNEGWGNPDNVVKDILTSGQVLLAAAVTRRIDKMGGPDVNNPGLAQFSNRDNLITNHILGPPSLIPPGVANPMKFVDEVILKIYTFEKQGFPIFPSGDVEKLAKTVYNALKVTHPQVFAADKKYKKKGTNFLVKKDAPDQGVKVTATRAAQSRGGFCGLYQYNTNSGASPTQAGRW